MTGFTEPAAPADPQPAKFRTSYSKEVRKAAKAEGIGMVTVNVVSPNGERFEIQVPADATECHFARWLGKLIEDKTRRPLPSLEELYQLCGGDKISSSS